MNRKIRKADEFPSIIIHSNSNKINYHTDSKCKTCNKKLQKN